MHTTPITLLERLRQRSDQEAWARFVQLYTPLLFSWARRCGLQSEDCADLTQDVLTILFQKLPEFSYDRHKSFRAWLHTVTLNLWRDRHRRRATRPIPGGPDRLEELALPDDRAAVQEDEYRLHLVGQALRLVRGDFQPITWQAFWEYAVLGRPVEEVAHRLGLTRNSVYCAKYRILCRLRQELRGLLD
jgi:RNA polymerase sigma-70 factor (ECF subfamily)